MTLRQAPARFFTNAPEIVRRSVLDLIKHKEAAPLEFDIILREPVTHKDTGEILEWLGLDFTAYGSQGQHFHLKTHEMRAYRESNRRNRVAWDSLPAATQSAIVRYLEQEV